MSRCVQPGLEFQTKTTPGKKTEGLLSSETQEGFTRVFLGFLTC